MAQVYASGTEPAAAEPGEIVETSPHSGRAHRRSDGSRSDAAMGEEDEPDRRGNDRGNNAPDHEHLSQSRPLAMVAISWQALVDAAEPGVTRSRWKPPHDGRLSLDGPFQALPPLSI